ncbi:hypothetical protein [Elizabethkingia sp. JS20170427COW]|uniref:hypothetical protein n=1 Tax=Elizabethkingia sp. JS20170427COW TaxID=2583851 RepID=UPI0011109ECB|nr:hypothetical protein [Elizabethkingia sp. JS20170427COW]QCX53513.1 hypothetical protein FGE20_07115 [Elizabethkingia sp. JS20170427COW]
MITFYKKRKFDALLSDTFTFVKIYGKSYFKNYFAINGIIISLLLIIISLGYGEIIQQYLSGNANGEIYLFEQYLDHNKLLLGISTTISVILFLIFSIINYSFPILYIKRLAETKVSKISLAESTQDLKTNFLSLILFFITTLLFIGVLSVFLFAISSYSALFTVVFFLLLLALPVLINIINFAFYDYIFAKRSIISSFIKACNIQFSKNFGKYYLSTLLLYFIIQIILSIFTFIPLLLSMFLSLSIVDFSQKPDASAEFLMMIVIVIYLISITGGIILGNLLYINTGLMYFDSREDLHQKEALQEIEMIGNNEK